MDIRNFFKAPSSGDGKEKKKPKGEGASTKSSAKSSKAASPAKAKAKASPIKAKAKASPVKKEQSPKKKTSESSPAAAAPQPEPEVVCLDDDDDEEEEEEVAVKTKAKAVVVPPSSKKKAKKRNTVVIDSDDEGDEDYAGGDAMEEDEDEEEDYEYDDDEEMEDAVKTSKKRPAKRANEGSPSSAPSPKAAKNAATPSPGSKASSSASTPASQSTGKRPWGSFGGSLERNIPEGHGSKVIPQGAENCLQGKTFVITGILDSLTRDEAEDIIKEYGGKITGSVSGKTSYLLTGSVLDDGRPLEEGSKYKKAQTTGTKMIKEDDLLAMLTSSLQEGKGGGGGSSSSGSSAGNGATKAKPTTPVSNPYSTKKPVANPYSTKKATPVAKPSGGASSKASPGSGAALALTAGTELNMLWADKYKPNVPADVVGNSDNIKKLTAWLQHWEPMHLYKTEELPKGGGQSKTNVGAKAALLSGPPGIGKSSTAAVVCKELGYHVTELNASDSRSKKLLQQEVGAVLENQVLRFGEVGGGGGGGSSSGKGSGKGKGGAGGKTKRVVIMDEVDGMAGNADRGGMQELIKLIKNSKVPIIAICNDRQHEKVRSLANHCLDLRFRRPTKQMIAKRMMAVGKSEDMQIDENAAEALVESCGNDIRQCLNAMQMWGMKSKTMSYKAVKDGLTVIRKDDMLRVSAFDAAKMIITEADRTPLARRCDAFFQDYNLMPLMVQQNYLEAMCNFRGGGNITETLAQAAAANSDADLIGAKVRGDVNNWSLLPMQAAMTVRVGGFTKGGSIGFPSFPEWMGKNSTHGKRRRLLSQLRTHVNTRISADQESLRMSYVPAFQQLFLRPLKEEGASGAAECVELLDEYGLSRDDLFENMGEFQMKGSDIFEDVSSQAKAAVTREYNSKAHMSQALNEPITAAKKGKKAKKMPSDMVMEGGEGPMGEDDDDVALLLDDDEDEEDDDAALVAALMSKGKGKGGKGGAKGKAAGKATGKAAAGKAKGKASAGGAKKGKGR